MEKDARAAREADIAKAAYDLLAEKGYGGTSMLAIAKRAKASNETLYRWYGDKDGLFRRMIERNAAEVSAQLTEALASSQPPLSVLRALGPKLLQLLTSDRAIALNRAAAADPTGALGAAILTAGRAAVGPLIIQVLDRASDAGVIAATDPSEALELYLNLLVGDMQIRRAIGVLDAPSAAECETRAAAALERFLVLMAPDTSAP